MLKVMCLLHWLTAPLLYFPDQQVHENFHSHVLTIFHTRLQNIFSVINKLILLSLWKVVVCLVL